MECDEHVVRKVLVIANSLIIVLAIISVIISSSGAVPSLNDPEQGLNIFASFTLTAVAVFGVIVACRKGLCLLRAYLIFFTLVFTLTMATAIHVTVHSTKIQLNDLQRKFETSQSNSYASLQLSFFQRRWACCGFNGPGDFDPPKPGWDPKLADSCCAKSHCTPAQFYKAKCSTRAREIMNKYNAMTTAFAVISALLMIPALICACLLYGYIKKRRRAARVPVQAIQESPNL